MPPIIDLPNTFPSSSKAKASKAKGFPHQTFRLSEYRKANIPSAALPAWRRSDITPTPYNWHHRCIRQNLTTILTWIPSSSGMHAACIPHYNDPS